LNIEQLVDSEQPLSIALMGPTASGKTALACALAQCLPCDIINVDSVQVYRDMDIGTAKPDVETLRAAPHRLLGFLDPAQVYSVAQFRQQALAAMQESIAAGRIPLLVGGTMLYFKALLYGIAELPPADADIRKDIEIQAQQRGWQFVHQRLAQVDPESARRINVADSQRLQRALEVYLVSGKSMTEWQRGQVSGNEQKNADAQLAADIPGTVLQLALAPQQRTELHRRIEQRFRHMVAQGLVEEVRQLWLRPELNPSLPAMRAVGYRQVIDYLEGELDFDQMIEAGVIATRQLAKRQLTWLRSWRQLHWILTDASGAKAVEPAPVADMTPLQAAIYYLRKPAG
jgi:tRNA dimethylallyltransferase